MINGAVGSAADDRTRVGNVHDYVGFDFRYIISDALKRYPLSPHYRCFVLYAIISGLFLYICE